MRGLFSQLYIQVLIGIVIGCLIGFFWPDTATSLQPFATGFIKLIKMLLAPIIFGTVVLGIAKWAMFTKWGALELLRSSISRSHRPLLWCLA